MEVSARCFQCDGGRRIDESGRHMERRSNGRKENQLVNKGQSQVR